MEIWAPLASAFWAGLVGILGLARVLEFEGAGDHAAVALAVLVLLRILGGDRAQLRDSLTDFLEARSVHSHTVFKELGNAPAFRLLSSPSSLMRPQLLKRLISGQNLIVLRLQLPFFAGSFSFTHILLKVFGVVEDFLENHR